MGNKWHPRNSDEQFHPSLFKTSNQNNTPIKVTLWVR
jgi:hypothetical protein